MPSSLSWDDAGTKPAKLPDSLRQIFDKIVPEPDGMVRVKDLARPVVFTNGVFDILHRGHVTYLAAARAMGGSLLVALNTDASARRLGKGPNRPVNAAADRAVLLAGLASVNMVTFFDEDTPCALLVRLRPDIYVKGGDYDIDALEEARLVRSWGGRAAALPFVPGFSTTAIIDRSSRG